MHDEGSLCAVPAEACGSGNRQRDDHLLVPEPGSAHGSCRLQEPQYPSPTEHRPGKAEQPLARLPSGRLIFPHLPGVVGGGIDVRFTLAVPPSSMWTSMPLEPSRRITSGSCHE